MDNEDILFEIGYRNKKMIDIEEWEMVSDPVFYKGCFEYFFKGYCKHNKYDRELVFRYIDVDKKMIGATTFYSDYLDSDFILFNFNSIPLIKSYYYTLTGSFSVMGVRNVWQAISLSEENINHASYKVQINKKSITYTNVINNSFYTSLAEFLTFVSAQFLFNHEVAHSLNGHTRFLNSKDYKQYLKNEKIDKSLIIKTLEMDADAYAAASLANYINNFNKLDLESIFPCIKEFSKTDISVLCVFAILSTYMCSSEYVKVNNNYLSAFMRAVLSIDVILEEFRLLHNNKFNKDLLQSIIFIAHEDYAKIYKQDRVQFKTIEGLFSEHEVYENEMRTLWKNSLRSQLAKYSIEELAG